MATNKQENEEEDLETKLERDFKAFEKWYKGLSKKEQEAYSIGFDIGFSGGWNEWAEADAFHTIRDAVENM